MSRLEAVNLCLSAADRAPVNSIETNTTQDARLIVNLLDAAHREVMNIGWDWNTEYEYTLEMSVDGTVTVPSSIIRFDPRDNPAIIQRGDRLYDRETRSYNINSAVRGTATLYLEWEELREEVKNYIQKMTARRFYQQHVGSEEGLQSLAQDEFLARKDLLDGELETGAYSIFDSPDMQAGLSRGNQYVGRASFNSADPFTRRFP